MQFWADLRRMTYCDGKFMPIEHGGERRVLAFVKPGFGGKYTATHTLRGCRAARLPGEIAPCHHSALTIGFIVERSRTRR